MDYFKFLKLFCLISVVFGKAVEKKDTGLTEISVNCDLQKYLHEKLNELIVSSSKSCVTDQCITNCGCDMVAQIANESVNVASLYMHLSDSIEGNTEIEEDNVDSIISWINFPGKINKAIKKFNRLPNKTRFVKRIVKESLTNPENFKYILEFVKSLKELPLKFIAAWTIFDEYIGKEGHKNSEKMLKMFENIAEDGKFQEFSKIDQRMLMFMMNDVKIYQIMLDRAELIESFYELKSLESKIDLNFKKLLSISDNLVSRKPEFNHYPENEKFFDNAMGEIPKTVKLMTSKDCVSIITSNTYYIHAKSGAQLGAAVYSGTPNQQDGDKWKWTVEIEKSEDNFYFYLKNLDSGHYMYASDEKYLDSSARRILGLSETKKDLKDFKWSMNSKENGKYFQIINLQYNEGLTMDPNSRRVFTSAGVGANYILKQC